MASEKENFIKNQFVPTGEPFIRNDHVTIYHVKCMQEKGKPEAILKLYHRKNVASLYERMMLLDYTEWPHIHGVKYFDGNTLVVEDYLKGATMKERMEGKQKNKQVYSEEEAYKIMDRICEAVSALNSIEPPLAHHNLTASNIFITDGGHVKFLDFEPGDPKKPHFNLIEFLGKLFHQMLTGKEPKDKVSYQGRYTKLIEKCLEKDPERQFKDVNEMKEDLEEAKDSDYEGEQQVVGIPYVLTVPFQGIILTLEWVLFSFFYQKDNTPTSILFGAIFGLHLLIYAVRRAMFIKETGLYVTPMKKWGAFAVLGGILALIYVAIGRFIVPIT